jgi:hypothetical protein
MTSVLRQLANNTRLPYPSPAVTLTYGDNKVVPFTYNKSNGVLDFDFSTGFTASTSIDSNNTVYIQGASFNALHNVTDIGPNIVAWCEGSQVNADVGSVKIVEKPIVVRTNQIAVLREPDDNEAMHESDTPFDFESASGSVATNYNATYVFKKPLVLTYTREGERKYRMFNTQFEGNT